MRMKYMQLKIGKTYGHGGVSFGIDSRDLSETTCLKDEQGRLIPLCFTTTSSISTLHSKYIPTSGVYRISPLITSLIPKDNQSLFMSDPDSRNSNSFIYRTLT